MTAMDELRYMGTARMLVIANSTFSWWSGLLASTEHGRNATIVLPDEWFGVAALSRWCNKMCTPPQFVHHPVSRPCALVPSLRLISWPDPCEVRVYDGTPAPDAERDFTVATGDGERALILVPTKIDRRFQHLLPPQLLCNEDKAKWSTTVLAKDPFSQLLLFELWQLLRLPKTETQFRNYIDCVTDNGELRKRAFFHHNRT
jgi:hypothetical protein